MAKFQEVLHQMQRYCDAQDGCGYCKPYTMLNYHCPLPSKYFVDNGASVEEFIMSWAAEHPESKPVYPTWLEWMIDNGLVFNGAGNDTPIFFVSLSAAKRIPADIAEKFGVEPKEGA